MQAFELAEMATNAYITVLVHTKNLQLATGLKNFDILEKK